MKKLIGIIKKKYENNKNENYEEFENDNINFRRAE